MVFKTTLSVKRAMPTKIPYWTEPLMYSTDVPATCETHNVNRIAADVKHKVERTHIVILKPALSLGALIKTKIKFKTPKTTAR